MDERSLSQANKTASKKAITTSTEPKAAAKKAPTEAKRAVRHISIGLVLFATLLAIYLVWAQRNHQTKMFIVDATNKMLQSDVKSLREAENSYLQALKIRPSNERAMGGLAEIYALLWLDHGFIKEHDNLKLYVQKAQKIKTAERYEAEMLLLLGEGHALEAVKLGQQLVAQGANNEKVYYAMGLAERSLGQLKEGREHLRRAYEMRRNHVLYAVALGDAFDADNDKYSAANYWEAAITSSPTYIPAVSRAALASIRRGSGLDKVVLDIQSLAKLPSENIGSMDAAAMAETRAALLWYQGKPNEAVAALTDGLTAASDNARLLVLRGQMLTASGHKDVGLKALEDAYTQGQGAARYLYAKAQALVQEGQFAAAIALLDKNKNDKDAVWFLNKAEALRHDGKTTEAAQYYDEALKIDGHLVPAMLGHGYLAEAGKHPDKAQEWFEKAVSVDAQGPEIYEAVGNLWTRVGAAQEAIKQYESAEKFYRLRGASVVDLQKFYDRVAGELGKAKNGKAFAKAWQKKA
jgi:tetratricopeptide (TPR) repeat protein